MDNDFPVQFLLSLGWIAFVTALSILYRRRSGKPIVPKMPRDPLYGEGRASGGMASNCLIVAVMDEALIVTPRFPFNLMFLPEVWGMEYEIPISSISDVQARRRWFGSNVRIRHAGRNHALNLRVLDPDAFVKAVARAQDALRR